MSIRVRKLRLVGASKDYYVDFAGPDDEPRPLSTIAGDISTGKSSVLEFIDYCLGASRHPTHIEIRRQVRSAQLELEVSGDIAVIERPVFSQEQVAYVHHCSLQDLVEDRPHRRVPKVLEPARDERSLSMFLLGHVGLAGLSLKEAPTQESSSMQPLSFRDLMWLCYLPNTRLDSKQLMHEGRHYMEQHKLIQVIEIIFGVHDEQSVRLSDQLRELELTVEKLRADIESLERFLAEEEVAAPLALSAQVEELEGDDARFAESLASLTTAMQAQSQFAESLRLTFSERQQEANRVAASVRYQETLLRRLFPLQSQYAEDETKLHFYAETKTLFDPLSLQVCPSCLQKLRKPPSIDQGECSLCGELIPIDDVDTPDVKSELAAVRARRREIDRYLDDVQVQLEAARIEHRSAADAEAIAQRELDDAVTKTLSPYIAQREQLVRSREAIRAQLADLRRQLGWHESLEQRRSQLGRLQQQATELRARLRKLDAERVSKSDVIADLTTRFEAILREFGYPKLDDPELPYLDRRFTPWVRGGVYRDIGSSGALTLISLAWQLALVERAVELGHPHPGFLMIDSPQKNLSPKEGGAGDEFTSPQIALNVWAHLLSWSQSMGHSAQLIIVDNHPPEEAADTVVVRFGGKYGQPPYGLIDNEID